MAQLHPIENQRGVALGAKEVLSRGSSGRTGEEGGAGGGQGDQGWGKTLEGSISDPCYMILKGYGPLSVRILMLFTD